MGSQFGVTGLAVMGQNLARNVARHGFPVAVHNRNRERTDHLIKNFGHEGQFQAAYSIEDFVRAIDRPRPILIMVKAGKPVDDVIDELLPYLDAGDILIDGGNSHFLDTKRREQTVEARGVHFLGAGISGGEEGALNGPSIMPGGSREAYQQVEKILTSIAAQVDGVPCCTYIGPDGAGHYVKMVHNGIEYADMQLIAEAYDLLRQLASMKAGEIAEVFAGWKKGDLDSYLIEITAEVLRKVDAATGKPLVDMIVDEAAQKGTGRWTVQAALDLGLPISTIAEAVFARALSSRRPERQGAAKILAGPMQAPSGNAPDGAGLIDAVQRALYASKIVAYAQGFGQMAAASGEYGWKLDLGAIATIWRGGCIIRASFLDRIKEAYQETSGVANLLFVRYFTDGVAGAQHDWRRVVSLGIDRGIPTPVFSAALAYYDGLRTEHGTGNLIQGLRDYFGAHTYHRFDHEGSFHTQWAQDGSEVQTGQ
jgi:6-phosphogluconate dehydrogenase